MFWGLIKISFSYMCTVSLGHLSKTYFLSCPFLWSMNAVVYKGLEGILLKTPSEVDIDLKNLSLNWRSVFTLWRISTPFYKHQLLKLFRFFSILRWERHRERTSLCCWWVSRWKGHPFCGLALSCPLLSPCLRRTLHMGCVY